MVVDQSQLVEAQKKTDNLLATFKNGARVLQGFAAALAGSALVNFITDTVRAADDVGDLAARLGVTTDEFQRLQAIASDVGTSVGALQTGFRTLASNMKAGSKELASLGVATKNSDGSLRSVTDVFWDAGAAIGATKDQATRLQLAQKLLGRGGLELLPIFTGGAEAIAKYRAQIAETAVVFDEQFIEASDKVSKQLEEAQRRFANLRAVVVSQILPAFSWLVEKTNAALAATQKFFKQVDLGQAALSAAGLAVARVVGPLSKLGGLAGRFLGWLRPLLPMIARFAKGLAAWLLIDDIITLFRGGDSIIGRVLDKMFGIGSAAKFVEGVKTSVDSLVQTLKVVWDWVAKLGSDTPMTADEFSAAFLKASEGIGKAFDSMFSAIWEWLSKAGPRILEWAGGLATSIGDALMNAMKAVLTWAANATRNVASEIVNAIPGASAALNAFGNVAEGLKAHDAMVRAPSLAPPRGAAGGGSFSDSRHQEIHVTVQGNATPNTAREVGRAAGNAVATMGRDREAIMAAVGGGQ